MQKIDESVGRDATLVTRVLDRGDVLDRAAVRSKM
jgi:hypothetical protein